MSLQVEAIRRGVPAIGAALALWLSLGALAIVGPSTAGRLGLLAPFWPLVPFIAIALAAAFLNRSHGWSSLLWLPALLLCLPWLPIVVPAAFLLWVGPLSTLIWAALIAAVCLHARPRWPAAVTRLFTHPVRAPIVAAAIACSLYLFAGWRVSTFLPAGDEPHYLVIADSLLRDGDLQIDNNHEQHQYLPYFLGELKPDYLRRGVNGKIYSIHAPGLPALLIPAFGLFGYPGAVAFLALLSALGSALAWRLCLAMTGKPGAAWFGWATAALPAPIFFHAFTIYPDGAGGLLVLTGVAALVYASRLTPTRALLHGAALAYLPWLHTRFVLLAAVLGACIVVRLATRRPAAWHIIGAFLAMPLVSAVGWFGSFYAIYGTTDPSAPYGTYTQSELAHVPAGLTGLLFDHQFGVIPNAPIFLVALCALGWLIVRRPRATMTSAPAAVSVAGVSVAGVSVVGVSAVITMSAAGGHIADTGVMSDVSPRRLAIELACVVTPYILAAAMYRMWWGGWSAPARFLVAVLPTLALPAAMCWAFARSKTTRASAMVALAASVWLSLSLLFVQNGRLAYNDRDGFALWTDWANPVVDLANGMPSLFRETWPAALTVAMIWTGLLAATWLALRLVEWRLGLASLAASDLAVSDRAAPDLAASDLNGQSRASRRQGLARAFPLAVVPTAYAVAAMLAFSLAWNYEHASGLRPDFAQIALLRRIYTGLRPWGVVYGQTTRIARPPQGADEVAAGKTARVRAGGLLLPSVVPASAIPARLSINSVARRLPRDQPLLYLPRVPSGRYRLFVTVLGIPDGRLDLLVGRSATPIRSYDLAAVTASPGVPQITRASFSNSNFTAASATSSMFTRETKHEFELTLPVNVSMMSVMPDARARKVVGKITLEPLAIPGIEADALPGQYAYQATRYGTTILYAATPDVYLEPSGLWVRPELETDLLIEPAQAVVSWTVFVRNGPVDNQVRLEVEGWHRELALPAGAEMEVTVPASRRGPTPLRIVSAKGFRPSAIDPKNGDHRRLGVWVEIR